MERLVTYRAADPERGMTPEELRTAFRRAIEVKHWRFKGFSNLRVVSVEVVETEPGVRLGIDNIDANIDTGSGSAPLRLHKGGLSR